MDASVVSERLLEHVQIRYGSPGHAVIGRECNQASFNLKTHLMNQDAFNLTPVVSSGSRKVQSSPAQNTPWIITTHVMRIPKVVITAVIIRIP